MPFLSHKVSVTQLRVSSRSQRFPNVTHTTADSEGLEALAAHTAPHPAHPAIPVLKASQVPAGQEPWLQISKGTDTELHFPKFPSPRMKQAPVTDSSHCPSTTGHGNWSVPTGWGCTVPLTHLGREQQPPRGSCPQLSPTSRGTTEAAAAPTFLPPGERDAPGHASCHSPQQHQTYCVRSARDLHPPRKPPQNQKSLQQFLATSPCSSQHRTLLPGRDLQQHTRAHQMGHRPFRLLPSLPGSLFASLQMSAAK